VTIAIRPLFGCGICESIKLFLVNREAKYFSQEGWTGICKTARRGKSVGLIEAGAALCPRCHHPRQRAIQ
jgi:hypothetical protein